MKLNGMPDLVPVLSTSEESFGVNNGEFAIIVGDLLWYHMHVVLSTVLLQRNGTDFIQNGVKLDASAAEVNDKVSLG